MQKDWVVVAVELKSRNGGLRAENGPQNIRALVGNMSVEPSKFSKGPQNIAMFLEIEVDCLNSDLYKH